MNKEKAYFFPRFIAYLLDIIIIFIIATIISYPFSNDKIVSKNEELNSLTDKFVNKEIDFKELADKYKDLEYDINYLSVPSLIVEITCVIVYFVLFQYYRNGQTVGKKIMKIRLVSNSENELTLNNYLCRSLLLNSVLYNMIGLFLILFVNKNNYFYINAPLQIVQEVLLLITIFMVLFKKDGRGLHDLLGKSKVIMVD